MQPKGQISRLILFSTDAKSICRPFFYPGSSAGPPTYPLAQWACPQSGPQETAQKGVGGDTWQVCRAFAVSGR